MNVPLVLFVFASLPLVLGIASGAESSSHAPALSPSEASRLARLALNCVRKELPNKPEHVINTPDQVRSPRQLHPAFYGCFDWHSSVHGHWMLARLWRLFPDLPEAGEIREAFEANLTAQNIRQEVQYLHEPNRQSFERTYGWAWLLKLAQELREWGTPEAQRWSANLKPLTEAIVERYLAFLPKQTYPIRTGVHPNTAFGLAFAFDFAAATGHEELAQLVRERSRTYFASDTNYPAWLEPGGEDFFSPALMEADLMRRVLPQGEFITWFSRFLPGLPSGEPKALLQPAIVTDRSDPKLVHLDGLNLSRAWCMRNLAESLPAEDPVRKVLSDAADAHAAATLKHVTSGDYAGEHWLGSFAVYMLSVGGGTRPEATR